jgi:hypothetical protein
MSIVGFDLGAPVRSFATNEWRQQVHECTLTGQECAKALVHWLVRQACRRITGLTGYKSYCLTRCLDSVRLCD